MFKQQLLLPPRLDPRGVHPGEQRGVRGQLPPLSQHPAPAQDLRPGGPAQGPAQVQVSLF